MTNPKGVICPYCANKAELVNGIRVYPHRRDLHGLAFYKCEPCQAWVGCHKGTTRPLGRLANEELRRAKSAAHRVFDPLWKNDGALSRRQAYKFLAERLGIAPSDCHIGMFDVVTCERVVAIMREERTPYARSYC